MNELMKKERASFPAPTTWARTQTERFEDYNNYRRALRKSTSIGDEPT